MNVLELCSNPHQEQDRYYTYLGLPSYEGHNVNNVEQITVGDDELDGVFGEHTIR